MAAEMDVDQHVWNEFFAARTTPGVFVEVGAARPDFLSISASFRQRGWRVIAVEPNPAFCEIHRAAGYDVHQYACSDVDADDAEFFVVDSHGSEYQGGSVSFESFSSLGIKNEFAELYETAKHRTSANSIRVKVRRLDTILREYESDVSSIDIVAIDVEGWELNVMRGLSLNRFNPRVVIMENIFKIEEYVNYMVEHDYFLWKTFEPNDIYVARSFKASLDTRLPR